MVAGGWTEQTPVVLSALSRLRDETNRALDAVQTGAPVPPALTAAWDALQEAV